MVATGNATPLIGLDAVVIDTETTGLDAGKARLLEVAVVHIVGGRADPDSGWRSLVQSGEPIPAEVTAIHGIDAAKLAGAPDFAAVWPELAARLGTHVVIGHTVGFDMAVLKHNFGVMPRPVYCTKVASRLARTFTDRHGLKDLCKELLGIELSKQQQSSDWGAPELTPEQLNYAASDVLHLHALREKLDAMLRREGREGLARACFEFLPVRAELDLRGWSDIDPFAH